MDLLTILVLWPPFLPGAGEVPAIILSGERFAIRGNDGYRLKLRGNDGYRLKLRGNDGQRLKVEGL